MSLSKEAESGGASRMSMKFVLVVVGWPKEGVDGPLEPLRRLWFVRFAKPERAVSLSA